LDNYGREAEAYLPTIEVSGLPAPVIRVIDQGSGEVVYALRLAGPSFRPGVFHAGRYTVEVGEPGTERWKRLEDLEAAADERSTIHVGL